MSLFPQPFVSIKLNDVLFEKFMPTSRAVCDERSHCVLSNKTSVKSAQYT